MPPVETRVVDRGMREAPLLLASLPIPLTPDDAQRLRAAEGYLTLGMHLEANDELEQIDPEARHVPEVFEVRRRDLPRNAEVGTDADRRAEARAVRPVTFY